MHDRMTLTDFQLLIAQARSEASNPAFKVRVLLLAPTPGSLERESNRETNGRGYDPETTGVFSHVSEPLCKPMGSKGDGGMLTVETAVMFALVGNHVDDRFENQNL